MGTIRHIVTDGIQLHVCLHLDLTQAFICSHTKTCALNFDLLLMLKHFVCFCQQIHLPQCPVLFHWTTKQFHIQMILYILWRGHTPSVMFRKSTLPTHCYIHHLREIHFIKYLTCLSYYGRSKLVFIRLGRHYLPQSELDTFQGTAGACRSSKNCLGSLQKAWACHSRCAYLGTEPEKDISLPNPRALDLFPESYFWEQCLSNIKNTEIEKLEGFPLTSWICCRCSTTGQVLSINWLQICVRGANAGAAGVLRVSCPAALWCMGSPLQRAGGGGSPAGCLWWRHWAQETNRHQWDLQGNHPEADDHSYSKSTLLDPVETL